MGTELNRDLLADLGFEVPPGTGPNDLVIAVRAGDDAALAAALAAAGAAVDGLAGGGGSGGGGLAEVEPPRTLRSAARRGGTERPTLALVSVPGPNAAVEAWDALGAGMNVMLFSDNVSVADEIALKDAAAAADLLVMGPDCGTAMIGGVALGFANAVRSGSIGLVAASGTGAQQVMCLLDAAGLGISHCLGVGGRDLSEPVAGRSTRQALAALDADEATSAIVVVSKPPAPLALGAVRAVADALATPVYWATLGPGRPDLTAAVETVLAELGHPLPSWPSWAAAPGVPDGVPGAGPGPGNGFLRGLFCGGTLADEAMLVASRQLGDIASNIPLRPELALPADLRAAGHLVIDFGDDALTRGRAHPMIDPTLRLERIAAEIADAGCGVLLLDLVLGHAAHPDPAGELAEAILPARARGLPVVVSMTGVEADPQGLGRCAGILAEAGASVFLSNAQATRHAVGLLMSTEG
jgi:FdrA protein